MKTRKAMSRLQSSGAPIVTSVFPLRTKEEEELCDYHDPETMEGLPSLNSDICFMLEEEMGASLMDHQGSNEDSGSDPSSGLPIISSVVPFRIKEEETCSTDHQDCERRESTSCPTAGPFVTAVFSLSRNEEEETHFKEKQNLAVGSIPVADPVVTAGFSQSRIMEKAAQCKDNHKFGEGSIKAFVTLDPDTVPNWLILSKGRRPVRYRERAKTMPDKPKRFDNAPCVLGREGYTSGSHYWEVKVLGLGGGWDVGVTKESVIRKGWFTLSPEEGVWAVGWWRKDQYVALTSLVTLLPQWTYEDDKKLGVHLDYERGRLSLYNANTKKHLYTFSHTFTEKIFPYFSIGYRIGPYKWIRSGTELRLV